MSLADATAVADAILYEGYLLYPYRASSAKNQLRWQFGIIGPPGAAGDGVGEEPSMRVECLIQINGPGAAKVDVHARFLQVQVRSAERAVPGGFQPVDQLTVGAATWIRWHEAVEQSVLIEAIPADLADAPAGPRCYPFDVPSGVDVELLRDEDDRVVGRLVRRRSGLTGRLTAGVRPAGPGTD